MFLTSVLSYYHALIGARLCAQWIYVERIKINDKMEGRKGENRKEEKKKERNEGRRRKKRGRKKEKEEERKGRKKKKGREGGRGLSL